MDPSIQTVENNQTSPINIGKAIQYVLHNQAQKRKSIQNDIHNIFTQYAAHILAPAQGLMV